MGLATTDKNGLLGKRGLQPKGDVSPNNYSNKLDPGIYSLRGEIVPGLNEFGQLIVLRTASNSGADPILHIVVPLWTKGIYYRFIDGLTYENYNNKWKLITTSDSIEIQSIT